MNTIHRFSFFLLVPSLFFLAGCTPPGQEPQTDASLPDLTSLYAQVCAVKEGPCTPMMCTMQASGGYQCAETIAKMGQQCGAPKTLDDVITSYQICGVENADTLSIFSYAQTLENLHADMSPAQLEQKIKEETAVVENGGTSSFLSTMLATAGGMILGGMISNALFNRPNAMPPARPASAYEQPMNKSSLNDAKTQTASNSSKVQKAVKQSRAAAAKKSSSSSSSKKTNSSGTKSNTKKRR